MSTTSGRRIVRQYSRGTITLAAWLLAGACGGGSNPVPETAASALPSALNAAGPLLNSLGAAVPGLSQAQSILAAGSMLGLAKAKMPAEQYSQVSTAIPGSDALVNEATKQGLTSSALSGLSGVTDFLGRSGITPDQVNRLIPVLGQSVQGKVSPEVATSFMNALRS